MGKASRRKQLDDQKRQFFAIHGDERSVEDRANARAMLDALQKKLEDDALREDGFYFVNAKYADSRKPRLTSGMKTRDFRGHTRNISDIQIVRIALNSITQREHELVILFTFGLDSVSIWNIGDGKKLSSLDVSSAFARNICGAAVHPRCSELEDPTTSITFAYATHQEISIHSFDFQKNVIVPAVAPIKAFDVASSYCTGHQQAISSMAFSHDGGLLATASWDSTCMVWKVASPLRVSGADESKVAQLTLLYVLPVHEEGASCLSFTLDDQMLVTCGECIVKVWDISILDEKDEDQEQTDESTPLARHHFEWENAIPYSISIEDSMNLFTFEESMTALVSNQEWVHCHQDDKPRTLLAPAQSDDERNQVMDIKLCLDDIIAEISSGSQEEQHFGANFANFSADNQKDQEDGVGIAESTKSEKYLEVLTPSESSRLKAQFRSMKTFDFEALFNPTLSRSVEHDEVFGSIPTKVVTRCPSSSDADSRLLGTFQTLESTGIFSSHTSTIADCAVAQELDLVVTVSSDKSVRYWSLEQKIVLETIRDAHDAPITCCTLTSPATCDISVYEMLLATGGSDNLVKVWRRNPPNLAECVFNLAGHYDAITTIDFDPSGVFLISASEDTTAIMWRVRPSSPDQPEVPIVVSVDRFAIGISWIEPLANGAKILHYTIRTAQVSSFVGDGSDIQVIPDTKVPAKYLSKVIDKLQPGVKYTLQVAAVNNIGVSPFSAATAPIETLAFIPSRIDRPVQYRDRQATCITLSWVAPCPNGAAILSYTIQGRPENSAFIPLREITVPVVKLEQSNTISTNLEYDPRRSSSHKSGLSISIHESDAKIKKMNSSKTVAQARTGRPSNASRVPSVFTSSPRIPDTLSYNVDGLWAGEVYQFVVAASNRCGIGEFSRVSDYVKMDCMAPDQPAKPVIVSVDKRELTVQWEKPRCNGSDILQYTVRWQQVIEEGNGLIDEAKVLLSRSIAGTKCTINGLSPGSPVQIWVSASNLVDNKLLTSLESPATDDVCTLCDVPDTPMAPELLEPSAHTLFITWVPPKRNGLPIDAYDVTLYSEEMQFGVRVRQLCREFVLSPNDLQCSSTDTKVTYFIHHLLGATFYSATVSARNGLGTSHISAASVPVQTKSPTVPDSVSDAPVVSDVTPTSAVVTWKLPAHDGGEALRSFHIEYSAKSNRSELHPREKMESGGDLTVSRGLKLHATFLKPHRVYRFRVSPVNRVGRANPSAWSNECVTPSLVEFTVTRYFAHRPQKEHDAARFVQRRYRTWKQAVATQAHYTAALVEILRHWHM